MNSLSHMFYNNKASVNLYLVQGGTNFGFWNGQQWNGQARKNGTVPKKLDLYDFLGYNLILGRFTDFRQW